MTMPAPPPGPGSRSLSTALFDRLLDERAATDRLLADGADLLGHTVGPDPTWIRTADGHLDQAQTLQAHLGPATCSPPADWLRLCTLLTHLHHRRGADGVHPATVDRVAALLHADDTVWADTAGNWHDPCPGMIPGPDWWVAHHIARAAGLDWSHTGDLWSLVSGGVCARALFLVAADRLYRLRNTVFGMLHHLGQVTPVGDQAHWSVALRDIERWLDLDDRVSGLIVAGVHDLTADDDDAAGPDIDAGDRAGYDPTRRRADPGRPVDPLLTDTLVTMALFCGHLTATLVDLAHRLASSTGRSDDIHDAHTLYWEHRYCLNPLTIPVCNGLWEPAGTTDETTGRWMHGYPSDQAVALGHATITAISHATYAAYVFTGLLGRTTTWPPAVHDDPPLVCWDSIDLEVIARFFAANFAVRDFQLAENWRPFQRNAED